jgi:hypothetical protein
MPDIPALVGAISGVKSAADIVKIIRESGLSLGKAEVKLKIADITEALADTKMRLVDVREELKKRAVRIAELELALEQKASVVRRFDAYYGIDDNGEPGGEAYCARCWTVEHHLFPLVQAAGDALVHVCPTCAARYDRERTEHLKPVNE